MLVNKFFAGLVGIGLGVAGAVAIARSPVQTDVNTIPEAKPLAATCPKIEWPYGCDWRPETVSAKHLSMHRSNRNRLYLSFFK